MRRVPKQKRSIEKVERILFSAAELIKENGVDGVTTHLVAEHAGIAVGSLYQFFPNIETVKLALVEQVMEQLYLIIMESLSQRPISDLAELSDRLIDDTVDFYQDHLDVAKTILTLRNIEAFEHVKQSKNEKVIEGIVSHIQQNRPDIDIELLRRKATVAVMVSDVMKTLVWTANSEQQRLAYVAEWKVLTHAYALTV
jgi:AcrR family transcriptional regulator